MRRPIRSRPPATSTTAPTQLSSDELRAAQGGWTAGEQRVIGFCLGGVGGFLGVVFAQSVAAAYEGLTGGSGDWA